MMDSASLPTGGCNFRELAPGAALTCGCQRFWLRRRRRRGKARPGNEISRISEDPRLNRAEADADADAGNDTDADSDSDAEECRCGHHACYHTSATATAITTATATAASRYSEAEIFGATSALSSASGTTTERGYSTAEPSPCLARHLKAHPHQHHPPPVYQPSRSASRSHSQPTTARGDRCVDAFPNMFEVMGTRLGDIISHVVTGGAVRSELAQFSVQITRVIEDMVEMKQTARVHHERLETVETFGSAIEDMRDKVDLIEDRANEVEEKVVSFENRLDDRGVVFDGGSEKRKPDEDTSRPRKRRKETAAAEEEVKTTMTHSFTTTTSMSTSFCGRDEVTTSRLLSIIEGYEQRIADLETTAAPSVSRPWVLEVVLLPPAPLRGIWTDPTCTGGYESSNPQSVSTVSATPPRRESTSSSSSSLQPRSFGIDSRLYRRLQTRGFIKPLHITGPSAHDVSSAITSAFGPLLDWCLSFHTPSTWQPLRKIHKQTTLEFLPPAEAAAVLWNVDFLRSSCIMRGRRQVLYLTVLPQPAHSNISWAAVRALAPTSADDASCWGWKDTLDAEWRPGTEGMTPALTAGTAASSRAQSVRSVQRQGSGLSAFEGFEAELSPRTIEWFMENPGVLEGGKREGEEEEEEDVATEEDSGSGSQVNV